MVLLPVKDFICYFFCYNYLFINLKLNLTVKQMQEKWFSKKLDVFYMFLLNLVFFCNFHEFIVYFTKCKRLCTYKSFLFLLSLCLQSLSFFFSEGLTLFSVFSFSLHLLEKGYHQYEFQKRQVDLGRIG